MTKKLLEKTSRVYVLYSVIVLIVSAPLFYTITKSLYLEETDETLILHKNEFLKYSLPTITKVEIENWNKYNRNIQIEPSNEWNKDSLFFNSYYDSLDNETEPYREINSSIQIDGNPYTYSARINLVETEDLMESIALLFFVIISLLLIGLFIITNILSIHLWKPFNEILLQIEQFEVDKASHPKFVNSNIEEFNRLNSSIEKLVAKNTSIYQSQREFVENAAHELQTPLAIFQGKIDTFIQSAEFNKDQNEMLSSLNDSVSRLHRLNKNLLLLSKIENDNYSSIETICLSETINNQLDFFIEQSKAKNIVIRLELSELIFVKSNPVLSEILISNLFLNSIRHNINNGQILVKLTNHSLSFSNTGQLEALLALNLFNRFSKSNPTEQGNGLGLAIVQKIANLNGWKVSYSFADNLHQFTVTF